MAGARSIGSSEVSGDEDLRIGRNGSCKTINRIGFDGDGERHGGKDRKSKQLQVSNAGSMRLITS